MDNNLVESTNGGAIGEFSVLTPSQKRALEKAEEEKQRKVAAEKAKRAEAALKRKKQEEIAQKKDLWRLRGLLCLSMLFAILFCWILSNDSNGTSTKIFATFGILFFGIGSVVFLKAIIKMKK